MERAFLEEKGAGFHEGDGLGGLGVEVGEAGLVNGVVV